MELVYLWVEEYKNIKEQGFNFSPRFTCKYENGELTIEEKKDYVSIFPENINITAIAGKNGSGKSSIFEFLYRFLRSSYEIDEKKQGFDWVRWQENLNGIFIVSISNKLYALGRTEESNRNIIFPKIIPENLIRFYPKRSKGAGDDKLLHNFRTIIGEEIKKNISVIWFDYSLGISYFSHYKNEYKDDFFETGKDQKFIIEPNKIFKDDRAINLRIEEEKSVKRVLNYFFNPCFKHDHITEFFQPDVLELRIDYKRLEFENQEELSIQELNTHYIKHYYNEPKYETEINKAKYLQDNLQTLTPLIDFYTKHPIGYDIPIDISIKKLQKSKKFDLVIDILSQLPRYLTLEITHVLDHISQRFSDLSSGEKGLLKIIGNLDYLISHSNSKTILLFLDEIETYLHPEWQRKFLYYIIPIFERLSNKKIYCFFATHSPFLLSDIPKENVIFLENGKQVYPNIETFGANIHTLLSHGFFMKEGLMGEFAKDKIQSIIKYHEEIKSKDLLKDENKQSREEEKEKYLKKFQKSFWNIHSIIGDDFIKQVIKNHLIEIEKIILGNDKAKQEEIKRLKAHIALLES
ncbi:MAG: AAA family ATPase [Sulfurospirillaceae bacterium]|nr:AAA family ATPase [Sulfurospirillaceae bacterium]